MPIYDLYMEAIFSAQRFAHIPSLYVCLYRLIVIMHTWVMHAYLKIRDHKDSNF